ncbi:c-type cytochrome [Bauldia litoralis]|uniref:c-type cytochrome n=1 Tax=Bauldia litoralis TaxID=665467 RepID=UPI003264D938
MVLRFMGAGVVWVALGVGGASAQSLEEQLAVADPAVGAKVFNKCKACHTVEEGGANRVGPNLWAMIDRPVANVEDYRYSDAMHDFGGIWALDRLDAYLAKPRTVVPGTKMVFAGLSKPVDRANLIAYLNQNSPEPVSFGAAEDAPGEGAEATAREEADYGILVDAPGVEETFAYCTPCHSEMIVAQQGKTRPHWADLFVWMVEEQGMAPIEEPDRSIILDYLAANYNEDRPNFPKR